MKKKIVISLLALSFITNIALSIFCYINVETKPNIFIDDGNDEGYLIDINPKG